MSLVNPEFRPALEQFLKSAGDSGPLNDATLKQMRSRIFPSPPLEPTPAVTEQMIPGPAGAPQVKVYVCGDAPGASKPAVLHIHGGGYVIGSALSSRHDIQDLAIAHNCVAVTVEYRLAPETRFPGSLEDNYAALRWMHTNAKELGIDVTRIAVKGESAGGGHAAALAIAARDRGEFPLCLQVLIYPMLDDRTGSSRQLPAQFGKYVWTPRIQPLRLDRAAWSPGRRRHSACQLCACARGQPRRSCAGLYWRRLNRPLCPGRYRLRSAPHPRRRAHRVVAGPRRIPRF